MSSAGRSGDGLYARTTAEIMANLERGVRPWHKPWDEISSGPISRPLRHNDEPYQGINVVTLWSQTQRHGYESAYWFTYRQAQDLGAFVRKGERGTPIVYTAKITKTEINGDGEEIDRDTFLLKEYTVFNALQCRGLPVRFFRTGRPKHETLQRIPRAERFFANTRYGGAAAFYSPAGDYIQMPPFACFRDAESHSATLAHELTHNAACRIMPRRM
jgi:antirestriction protein ArdC